MKGHRLTARERNHWAYTRMGGRDKDREREKVGHTGGREERIPLIGATDERIPKKRPS